jgi:hypothetical protein
MHGVTIIERINNKKGRGRNEVRTQGSTLGRNYDKEFSEIDPG